jgi:hypothetical protein
MPKRTKHTYEERQAYANMCRSVAAFESTIVQHGPSLVDNDQIILDILDLTIQFRKYLKDCYYEGE